MKAYADTDQAIGAAKKILDAIDEIDTALYALDGEIPNDQADKAVKDARTDLAEVTKRIGYLASGMWRAGTTPTPSHWDVAGTASSTQSVARASIA
jgi:hypothetical protein